MLCSDRFNNKHMLIKTRANKYQWDDCYLILIMGVSSEVLCSSSFLWSFFFQHISRKLSKTVKYPPPVVSSHFHASKSEKEAQSPKRSQPSKRFIKVNNGVTSSNQPMAHLLSSRQPWFPHLPEEKEKKNESFDTFYRRSRPVLQKSSSFFKHILFGWGGHAHFDSCELSGFLSWLLLGTEWQQLTSPSCSSF